MKMANQEDENITVSKIYETLKSGTFLKNLYWDVLSDIKEKNSFKQMKETTEKLIHKKTESLANLSDSPADILQRKKIVTEICSMTYTVDTVFSKIMFIKLQKEFKSQIIECIKDLRKEKKINDSVWSKLAQDPAMKSLTESSTSKSNVPQQKSVTETASRPIRNKRHKMTPNEIAIKNYEIRSEIHKDLKAINCEENRETYMKKLRVKNHVTPEKQTETMPKGILKKKQNDEKQISASSPRLKDTKVKSKEKSFFKNTEEIKITPEGKAESDEEGSDTDSIISVGHVSTASVSSVHTSDLSSFDDEISLSSEDELDGVKRKISLKELKKVCNGTLPEKLDSSILKDLSEVSKESWKNDAGVKSKQDSEDISKKKLTENNKSSKNQSEDNLKRKAAENNKQQIEESSKRKNVGNTKHQVEDNSKRKANEDSNSQVEKSPKKQTTETNQSQIEESPKKKTAEANKFPVERLSNKSPVVSKKRTQSFQELLDSADKATELLLDSSKTLKRIRKPNSKYSSDNILCTITKVKERKKPTAMDNEKLTSQISQPSKKRTRKNSSDLDEEIPTKNLKIVLSPEEKETKIEKDSKLEKDTKLTMDSKPEKDTKLAMDSKPDKDMKLAMDSKPEKDSNLEKDSKPEKETKLEKDSKPESDAKSNTPVLSTPVQMFKPQFPVRSLTSRRTAPVTLFST